MSSGDGAGAPLRSPFELRFAPTEAGGDLTPLERTSSSTRLGGSPRRRVLLGSPSGRRTSPFPPSGPGSGRASEVVPPPPNAPDDTVSADAAPFLLDVRTNEVVTRERGGDVVLLKEQAVGGAAQKAVPTTPQTLHEVVQVNLNFDKDGKVLGFSELEQIGGSSSSSPKRRTFRKELSPTTPFPASTSTTKSHKASPRSVASQRRERALKLKRDKASLVLQKYARRWLAKTRTRRLLVQKKTAAVNVIKAKWKTRVAMWDLWRVKFVLAAVRIQKVWRGVRGRRRALVLSKQWETQKLRQISDEFTATAKQNVSEVIEGLRALDDRLDFNETSRGLGRAGLPTKGGVSSGAAGAGAASSPSKGDGGGASGEQANFRHEENQFVAESGNRSYSSPKLPLRSSSKISLGGETPLGSPFGTLSPGKEEHSPQSASLRAALQSGMKEGLQPPGSGDNSTGKPTLKLRIANNSPSLKVAHPHPIHPLTLFANSLSIPSNRGPLLVRRKQDRLFANRTTRPPGWAWVTLEVGDYSQSVETPVHTEARYCPGRPHTGNEKKRANIVRGSGEGSRADPETATGRGNQRREGFNRCENRETKRKNRRARRNPSHYGEAGSNARGNASPPQKRVRHLPQIPDRDALRQVEARPGPEQPQGGTLGYPETDDYRSKRRPSPAH